MVITTVKITSGSAKWSDTCMNVSDLLTFFDCSHIEALWGNKPRTGGSMNKTKKALTLLMSCLMFLTSATTIVSAEDGIIPDDVQTLTEGEEPTETEPAAEEIAEKETEAEETVKDEPETDAEATLPLNAADFYQEYTVGDLNVTVSYATGTLPEGTETVVTEGKPEALAAIKEKNGDDLNYAAADISFVFNGEEIEPKDYSDQQVSVTLTYIGEEDLSETEFETLHVNESVDEEGNVVYDVETVDAVMVDEKAVVSVPYEYTWAETVTKYKDVDVYEDVQVPVEVEKEVPVYETRDITEERTTYVTKTRQVEKTRTVKVTVAFKWYDPSTWLGYKYVTEKYYETETYEEPVTETVVVGTEEVQVGTETVIETEYVTEQRYVRTDKVEDGTEEVEHTETRYRDEEVVVGQTATFSAGDFSTYTMTWGTNSRVTIHHGIMRDGAFVEFGTSGLPSSSNTNYPTTLSWSNYDNNDYAVLVYDFEGYSYSAAYYRTNTSSTPASGGTPIWPALQKVNAYGSNNDNWRYCSASRTSWNTDGACANNGHIYLVYEAKTIRKGYIPSSDGDEPGTPTPPSFTPDVGKDVTTQKPDGTYDITLGFVGNKDSSETKTTARVIVVFDLSGSMENNMAGGDNTSTTNPARITLAKRAVNALAETLLALEDKAGNKLVEMGLVTFAKDARIRPFGTGTNASNYTSDYETYSGVVSNLPISNNTNIGDGIDQIGRGTNWEKAMDLANSMETSKVGKTYIILVSDGNPSARVSRGNYSDTQIMEYAAANDLRYPIFGGTKLAETNYEQCYSTAREVAKSIVDNNKTFYAVGLSTDPSRMQSLATYSGGTYKPGNDAEEFAESLADIAGSISSEIGLTDVTIADGVTDMSQISTESLIGTAGDYVYNKSYPLTPDGTSYTYTIGEQSFTVTQAQVNAGSDGTHRIFSRRIGSSTVYYVEYPWDIPEGAEADVNENNAVIWDTSAANSELEHGVYYSVTFTVWPKQEAYDLIADLDNEIRYIYNREAGASDLQPGVKAQLRVLINGSTTYEYSEGVPNGFWSAVGSDEKYTDEQMQTIIDNSNSHSFSMKTNTGLSASYKYGGVANTTNYTNYTNGNMTLDDTVINIKKTWNNYMDAREASDVTLTIIRTDDEGNTENYFTVPMGEPQAVSTTTGGMQWIQTPDHDLFISLGVMSEDAQGNLTIREKGYDYTVVEPENFSYRWDLTADIYHPMVINGTSIVLVEIEDTADLPDEVKNLEQNKSITSGGKKYYAFEDHLYVAQPAEDNLLEATNDRRSNLFINKVVEEENAPEDDLFPFEITINNPDAPHPEDEGYSEEYHTSWFYVSTAQNNTSTMIIDELTVSDNVTPEIDELRTDNSRITDIVTHDEDDEHPYPYITYNYNGTPNLKRAVDLDLHTGTETVVVDGEEVTREYSYYSYYTGYYWFDNGETATVSIKDGWYINFNNVARDSEYTIVEPTADMPDGYTFIEATTDATNVQGLAPAAGTVDGITVEGTIDMSNSDYTATYKNKYEGFFYVYHSSDRTVERFPMAVDGVKVTSFNVYALTKDNTLYGGYYNAYAKADPNTGWMDNWEDGYEDTTGEYKYVGEKGVWVAADANVVDGKAMAPEADATYYLKEVDLSYLKPYTHYSYTKPSGKINYMWFMSGIDDKNYRSFGYEITDLSDSMNQKADKATTSLTITNNGGSTTLKAKTLFRQYGMENDAYLAYYKDAMNGKYIKADGEKECKLAIRQYWVTPDEITVYGDTTREITISKDGLYNEVGYNDTTVEIKYNAD